MTKRQTETAEFRETTVLQKSNNFKQQTSQMQIFVAYKKKKRKKKKHNYTIQVVLDYT